jgi:hypothetical protein
MPFRQSLPKGDMFEGKSSPSPSSDPKDQTVDSQTLAKLLSDPLIVRMVTILNITSLSILELLEYGFTRTDINHALKAGVLESDNKMLPTRDSKSSLVEDFLITFDQYYYQILGSKLRLSQLGQFLLECIEGCQTDKEVMDRAREKFAPEGTFNPPPGR